MSKSKFNFEWDLTDENFGAMMKEEARSGLFGSVRIGTFLVEFRCTCDGMDPDYHLPTTDVYIFGKEDPEENCCVNQYFANGTPYLQLDDEIVIPKRRDLEHFRVAFELRFVDWLQNAGKKYWEEIWKPTVSKDAWDTGNPDQPAPSDPSEIRVYTPHGALRAKVVRSKYYPGIWVDIERPDGSFGVALIEVDLVDNDVPMLKAHIYKPGEDEPVYDARYTIDEVDKDFE